ncbi:hypothetical protein [Bacillus paranthracis]|nr:hypothetical protein [Bacillus paranthracis]
MSKKVSVSYNQDVVKAVKEQEGWESKGYVVTDIYMEMVSIVATF